MMAKPVLIWGSAQILGPNDALRYWDDTRQHSGYDFAEIWKGETCIAWLEEPLERNLHQWPWSDRDEQTLTEAAGKLRALLGGDRVVLDPGRMAVREI